MSQENRGCRIADDFPSIAARLRELSGQSRQVVTQPQCRTCDNRGWLWSSNLLEWSRCPHCGMLRRSPKPQPRR
jgi:predicted Zn-ribbon and HTH transcriptional regulator